MGQSPGSISKEFLKYFKGFRENKCETQPTRDKAELCSSLLYRIMEQCKVSKIDFRTRCETLQNSLCSKIFSGGGRKRIVPSWISVGFIVVDGI